MQYLCYIGTSHDANDFMLTPNQHINTIQTKACQQNTASMQNTT